MLGTPRTKVGIFPASTETATPLLELACAAEDRGFTSMVFNEHTHIPVEHPRSSVPAGGEVAERYGRFWDPFIASAFVAATTTLEVGTCVSLVAEYSGEFVQLRASQSWPKPAQPKLPVLLGAPASERNFTRIATWADGWIPMGNTALESAGFETQVGSLRRVWAECGRDPATLRLTVIRRPARAATLRVALDRADRLGVERVVMLMHDQQADDALSLLDHGAAAFGAR